MPATFTCPVFSYQQFTPSTGGGWRQDELTFSRDHTAVVVMHAIQPPEADRLPGWHRAVPYLEKSRRVLKENFPPLLDAIRGAGLPVFHVPGLVPSPEATVSPDPTWVQLRAFRAQNAFPGKDNEEDVATGWAGRNFAPEAHPLPGEALAETSAALHALASARGINHLIYIGFALNWCLLMSPGGMVDMNRHGYLCSTVREAVATVEPGAAPEGDREMQSALWRVAVAFGFVFTQREWIAALSAGTVGPS